MASSLFPRVQTWLGHMTQSEATPRDEFTGSSAKQRNTAQTNESAAAGLVTILNFPRMQTWLGHVTQSEATPRDEFPISSARQRNNIQANESATAGPVISLSENFKDFWGMERHWHNDSPDSAQISALASARASKGTPQPEMFQTLPETPRMPMSEPLRDFWGLVRGMSQDISEQVSANLFADSMMPQKMLPKIEMESVEVVEVPYEVYFNILTILPASDWLPCSVRKNYPDLKNFHAALSRELPYAWLPGFPSPQSVMELADSAYHLRLSEYLACIACTEEAIKAHSVQDFFNVGMEDQTLESARSFDEFTSVHGRPCCVICLEEAQETALDPCGHVCMCLVCSAAVKDCPLCRAPIENVLRVFLAG